MATIEFFQFYIEYSATTLRVKNSVEIALSLTVSNILTFLVFPQKFKMAAKSCENWNFLILYRILFDYPVSQKFCPNRSISYGFWDLIFFCFSQKFKMAAKSGENWNFSILYRILSYYPTGQKFCPNRSISYGFWDIRIFSFFAKIQDGRQKWRKLKFFNFVQNTFLLPCELKILSKSLYLLRFVKY